MRKGNKNLKDAFLGLISFIIIACFSSLWFYTSNVQSYPFLFILSIGLCIGELTVSFIQFLFFFFFFNVLYFFLKNRADLF